MLKKLSRKIFLFSLLIFTSCGDDIYLGSNEQTFIRSNFFMTTDQELLKTYSVIQEVNLYDLFPDLDNFEITRENFWSIMDALELNSRNLRSSYALLVKEPSCTAKIGYCKAYYLNYYKE